MPRIGWGFPPGGVLAAELPDRSLVVGASIFRGSTMRVVLRGVNQDCRAVASFGKRGQATVTVAAKRFADIDAMATTPNGQLILAGTDNGRELVARLLPDGRLDTSFAHNGWARPAPHEKPVIRDPGPAPTVTSIAFGSDGSIFLGGNDGEAHCCAQDFVTKLAVDGLPAANFGDGGSVVLPQSFQGSYVTDVLAAADGSAYVQGELDFGGCGGPTVVRIRRDGSLDTRFDSAIARSIRSLTRHRLDFSPRVVPGRRVDAFALIGDLDDACGIPIHPARASGLAVGILRSGRIDASYGRSGQARFPSLSNVPFPGDRPALQLPSGDVLLASVTYTSRCCGLKRVVVRAFTESGSVDRTFGEAGVRTFEPKHIPHSENFSVGLAAAAHGNARLVLGFPAEIDLVPIAG